MLNRCLITISSSLLLVALTGACGPGDDDAGSLSPSGGPGGQQASAGTGGTSADGGAMTTTGDGGDAAGGAGGSGDGGAGAGEAGATPLDHYATGGPVLSISQIGDNLSGNTYNPATQTHLLILNNNKQIHELDASFNHLRQIHLGGINGWDLEDISYLGTHAGQYEYALVNENGRMYLGVIPDDASTTLSLAGFQQITFAPPPAVSNKGAEGIAYDPVTQTFWACSERSPMIIYQFARPAGTAPVSYDSGLTVTQPFDAESAFAGLISDISSCFFDSRTGRLLVLSHQSSRVLDVGLDGTVHGQLALSGATQYEGLSLGPDEELVLTSEPNLLQVYAFSSP